MAKARYAQTNFLGGEWSKTAQGRFDLPTYRTALNVCLNGYPIETGAWTRRGGTRFLGATKKGLQATLKKFDFSQDIPYTMEFTQGFLRFWAGTSLATTNDDMTVTAISAANPAVVTIAAAPTVALVSGQTVFFNGLGTNNPLLQNRRFTITVLTAVTFSLQDEITAANIDGSTLGAFVSGTMSRVQEIATTYAGATQLNLRSVQAELQSVLLNGTAPMVLTAVQFGGATFSTFTLAPAVFRDGPYLDPVKGNITVTPGALSGTVTLTLAPRAYSATQGYTIGDYVTSGGNTYRSIADLNINNAPPNASWWKSVPPDDFIGTQGFTTSDIGRMIRLFSEPALWLVGTAYVTGNHVKYNNVYWVALQNSTGKTPGADTTNWGLAPESAVWTWGKISSLSSLIANVSNIGNYSSLANAFDGNIGTSAFASGSTGFGGGSLELVHQFDMYAGQNYGGTPKKIASAIAYPDKSLGWMNTSNGLNSNAYVIVNLRAKNSAPGSPSDGTLLGTSGNIANSSNAVTINSSDASTSWQYVWLEVFYNVETHVNSGGGGTWIYNVWLAEAEFFTPSSGGSASINVIIMGDPLLYTAPVLTWRLGVYNNVTWPTCGTYHEGRLWLAGAIDNRIDGSVSNDLFNFAPTNSDGSISADRGMDYTFNAPDVNAIVWMYSDERGIVCGSQAGEWLVRASDLNSPLSPTNAQAHRATTIGCANIEPRRAGLTFTFVQHLGRKVMEYFADVFSGRFTAPNLSVNAKHLTQTGIEELAYTQELSPVLWARRGDGQLIGCSYKRETLFSSQGPTFMGWHKHTLGSGRTVESIATGPDPSGALESLLLSTTDTFVSHVEMLNQPLDEGAGQAAGWFLDDAVIPSSTTETSTNLTVNGLWHLNGKTVSMTVGGIDCGDYTVSNGSFTATFGTPALFTKALVDGGAQIVVGFTYTSQGQTVRPVDPKETGSRIGPALGTKRRSDHFAVLFQEAAGVSVGTNFSKLLPVLFKDDGQNAYAGNQLFSGVWWDTMNDDYTFDGMFAWQITRPLPCTIVAFGNTLGGED